MTLKFKIIAINKIISDIYQKQMRLSYLLAKMKFTEEDIQVIANQFLTDTIQEFCNELIEAIKLLGWEYDLKSSSLDDNKQQYQKAYEKWTLEEEKLLVSKFEHGFTIKEIAVILARQPGAINSRLRKLGLK